MSIRRLLSCFVAPIIVALAAPTAAAQEQSLVSLTLVSQSPTWNTPKDPQVEIRFHVQNLGDTPLEHLSASVSVYSQAQSRTDYETSLSSDVGIVLGAPPLKPLDGTIEPGASKTFDVKWNLAQFPGVFQSPDPRIFPLKLQFGASGVPLGDIRTPIVWLVEHPKVPLDLTWSFVLDEQILFSPDGVFRSSALEKQLAPGGRLAAEIGSLKALTQQDTPVPVDVAVSPTLLMQLQRMRDGYSISTGAGVRHVAAGTGPAAAAATALDELRHIANATDVQLSALPYSAPSLPTLAGSGLARDIPAQLSRGRQMVANVLQAKPSETVLRPPRSLIDASSAEGLARAGIGTLLLDAGVVREPFVQSGFAPPPMQRFPAGGSQAIEAVAPDPAIASLLASQNLHDDPILGARALVGDLAAIWLESPSSLRGVAISFPETQTVPSAFFGPFTRAAASAPWLAPISATGLQKSFPPSSEAGRVPSNAGGRFSRTYVRDLKDARSRVEGLRSIFVRPNPLPDRLDASLLLAESAEYVDIERLGHAFIDSVNATLSREFGRVTAGAGQVFTLTPGHSAIPVRITRAGSLPLRVTVQLASPRLQFTTGASKTLVLVQPQQTLTFDVTVQSYARFPVEVLVKTPNGQPMTQSTIFVRSTAFNKVALLITIAAALVLLALWVRRLARERSS